MLYSKVKSWIFIVIIIFGVPLAITSYHLSTTPSKDPKIPPVVPTPPQNPYLQEMIDQYHQDMKDLLASCGIPGGAIAIVKDTSILLMKGLGIKSIHHPSDSVDSHSVFRIGSVSKCFAGVLASILVSEGQFNWEDPIVNFIPSFRLNPADQTSCLTLRHVLSHTTGFPYHTYTTLIEEGKTLGEMIDRLEDIACADIGKTYSYQNVAFSMVEKVIKKATGKSYETLLQEKLFNPLNMKNSSANYMDIITNCNVAYPHKVRKSGARQIPISDKYYNTAAAGGINTNISDMAKWMIALLGHHKEIIPPASLQDVFTPVVEAVTKNRHYRRVEKVESAHYGLGWRILHYPQDTVLYHGGYVNGYRSELALLPQENLAICILANAPGKFTDKGIPLFLNYYFENRDLIRKWEKDKKKSKFLLTRSSY